MDQDHWDCHAHSGDAKNVQRASPDFFIDAAFGEQRDAEPGFDHTFLRG